MSAAAGILLSFLGQAWTALVAALVVFGLLAMLVQALRAAVATAAGSRFGLVEALGGAAGLLLVVLFALLVVPALVQAVEVSVGDAGACGPLADLGLAAAGLIGALAAVRMLSALIRSAVSAVGGGSAAISTALAEAGESVLGMLLAVVSGPVAGHFIGLC